MLGAVLYTQRPDPYRRRIRRRAFVFFNFVSFSSGGGGRLVSGLLSGPIKAHVYTLYQAPLTATIYCMPRGMGWGSLSRRRREVIVFLDSASLAFARDCMRTMRATWSHDDVDEDSMLLYGIMIPRTGFCCCRTLLPAIKHPCIVPCEGAR